ncbi:MAG: MFS transporter, partial [Methylobacteriaceae bacterium]|nr:MFS transporter [Methylobacteriaceae bacterium]
MNDQGGARGVRRSVFAPLAHPVFRRMWLASLLSNLGLFILSVGAAWSMAQLTPSPTLVALVQTASMAPVALFALFSGAVADMFDRRKVAIAALLVSAAGAAALTGLAAADRITPAALIVFCFVVGSGSALLWPAWGASASEMAPPELLPAAVALNGVSFNVARSLGPALGGAIVAAAGGVAAFAICALGYAPLLFALASWRRQAEPARLPPESLSRAVISGLRYVRNAPTIRVAILRTTAIGFAGGGVAALLPLIARDLLKAEATTFGLLLGCFGLGAVIGALNLGRVRAQLSAEATIRACAGLMAVAAAAIAQSRSPWLTGTALLGFGAGWTGAMMCLNVTVQTAKPRWVAARAL